MTTQVPFDGVTPELERHPAKAVLTLALPVVVVQLGMMAMGVVDTIMVGHLSADALAAVALGNLYFFVLSMFGLGMLMVLDPLVAQALGAGDQEGAALALQRGVVLAVIISIPTSAALLVAGPLLSLFNEPPGIVPLASAFCIASIPGTLPFLVFVVFRQSLQAMRRIKPIVITVITANFANVALNYLLIYGNFGFPRLGVVGSALASTISRYVLIVMLLLLSWKILRPYVVPIRRGALMGPPLRRMAGIALPLGFQVTIEGGVFALVGLLMGWLGTAAMAGHQITINMASLTFMVPLGISMGVAVVVGHAVGRADSEAARRSARYALLFGATFMAFCAVVLLAVPVPIARIYTNDPAVIDYAKKLIPIAGLFQIFDGLQVVSAGILRGYGDTRTPLVANVIGFWGIGMPISVALGVYARSATGLWWGLVAGLAAVAVFLVWRVEVRVRRGASRLRV